MSAEAIELRPFLQTSPDVLASPSPLLPETQNLHNILKSRRANLRILKPAGTDLSSLIGNRNEIAVRLQNRQSWKISATPNETFMGVPTPGMENKASHFSQPFDHMMEYVEYLSSLPEEHFQLGRAGQDVRHTIVADFLTANWGLPCATEVPLPNGKRLDFVGLGANGKIVVADITSSNRETHYLLGKMNKLRKVYINQLKNLHTELYGTKINFLDFDPYVITYNFYAKQKALTLYDFEDVHEFLSEKYLLELESQYDENMQTEEREENAVVEIPLEEDVEKLVA